MIVQIGGYYGDDRHMINIDKVESVSMERERRGGSSDNWELNIKLTHQNLNIQFLTYKDRCEKEYDTLVNALRHREGELILPESNSKEK